MSTKGKWKQTPLQGGSSRSFSRLWAEARTGAIATLPSRSLFMKIEAGQCVRHSVASDLCRAVRHGARIEKIIWEESHG
jgi:hypothetical protein